jgi:hypothetical protein
MATVPSRTEPDLFSITGVQIFRAGKWNGDTYTVSDLDAMAAAATEVSFGIPIKAGHTDEGGKPALGWVENLRRVGESLYADLVALPKKVFDAIKSRGYDAVSAEIYWDLDRNGKTFPRVLKALALLGAEIPAVDLPPLRAFLSMMPALPAARFAVYGVTLVLEEPTKTLSEAPMEPEAKDHASDMLPPDAQGNCPDGYTKGEDDMCHLTPSNAAQAPPPKESAHMDTTVKDGEIVVSLAELRELKAKAATAERVATLEQDLKRQSEEAAAFADQQRERTIAFKVREVKIPAFRSHIRALYDMASLVPDAKLYALMDPKITMTAEAVIDDLVKALNKQADLLFRTLSIDSKPVDLNEPDQIAAKIDYRITEYVRAHKLDRKKDYKLALHAVLDADPDLKDAYSR